MCDAVGNRREGLITPEADLLGLPRLEAGRKAKGIAQIQVESRVLCRQVQLVRLGRHRAVDLAEAGGGILITVEEALLLGLV